MEYTGVSKRWENVEEAFKGSVMSRHKRGRPQLNVVSLYWSLWILGTVLIVLGWFRLVHPLIAWVGFFITSVVTIMSVVFNLTAGRQRDSVPVSGSTRPIGVEFGENSIQIRLIDGRVISAPVAWYPKLEQASAEERTHYELDSNGIYWPDLDVDVSVLDVLDGARPLG
jgi:hypothetical protein